MWFQTRYDQIPVSSFWKYAIAKTFGGGVAKISGGCQIIFGMGSKNCFGVGIVKSLGG